MKPGQSLLYSTTVLYDTSTFSRTTNNTSLHYRGVGSFSM